MIAHYWGGNRFTTKKQGYYDACLKRGWYVICPELHGKNTDGTTSLAALGAQHDIIDSINHMKKNYNIDESRIYLAGRSMGGMLAQIMAAKYPDVFAAVVAGMGVSDLKSWIDQNTQVQKGVIAECGNYAENPFEFHRRSSIYYAANFKYVPLILWHGTNDRIVPPEQTLNLFQKIKAANRFQPYVHWLHGAPHKAGNFTPEWVLNRLRYFQNISEPEDEIAGRSYTDLKITTDEKKNIFLARNQSVEGGALCPCCRQDKQQSAYSKN